jgi:colicin import membrane protein
VKRRYPLESLRAVKKQQLDRRALAVAEQTRRVEQAQKQRSILERERDAEESRARRIAAAERGRLEAGGARVADLASMHDWAASAAHRIAERRRAERSAGERETLERDAETSARAALAGADAEAKAVEKHRGHWHKERDAAAERAVEEEAQDRAGTRLVKSKQERRR